MVSRHSLIPKQAKTCAASLVTMIVRSTASVEKQRLLVFVVLILINVSLNVMFTRKSHLIEMIRFFGNRYVLGHSFPLLSPFNVNSEPILNLIAFNVLMSPLIETLFTFESF